MDGIGQLSGIALECRDPAVLAEFYSRLTGWPIVFVGNGWCSIGDSANATLHLSFQHAPGYQPPTWPDAASSMQAHLHVRVTDLDTAQAEVLAAGATIFAHQPDPAGHRVFADPAGHPFCLCPIRP